MLPQDIQQGGLKQCKATEGEVCNLLSRFRLCQSLEMQSLRGGYKKKKNSRKQGKHNLLAGFEVCLYRCCSIVVEMLFESATPV